MLVSQYCQQHGVNYASFSKWRQHFSHIYTLEKLLAFML
ncbi:hypothetical protein [Marinomonas spartinae]